MWPISLLFFFYPPPPHTHTDTLYWPMKPTKLCECSPIEQQKNDIKAIVPSASTLVFTVVTSLRAVVTMGDPIGRLQRSSSLNPESETEGIGPSWNSPGRKNKPLWQSILLMATHNEYRSYSLKDRAKSYASLHSKIYEFLWSHKPCNLWHRDDNILQTTNILRNNACACVESSRYLTCFFVCFPILIKKIYNTNIMRLGPTRTRVHKKLQRESTSFEQLLWV